MVAPGRAGPLARSCWRCKSPAGAHAWNEREAGKLAAMPRRLVRREPGLRSVPLVYVTSPRCVSANPASASITVQPTRTAAPAAGESRCVVLRPINAFAAVVGMNDRPRGPARQQAVDDEVPGEQADDCRCVADDRAEPNSERATQRDPREAAEQEQRELAAAECLRDPAGERMSEPTPSASPLPATPNTSPPAHRR